MICRDKIIINNKEFFRTYSDQGYYIIRDGRIFVVAYDPITKIRIYEETNQKIK